MSVRRLADKQPESFAFNEANLAWAKKQIAKYPEGRQASAIIPLMWRAQEQHDGWLPEPAIRYLADMLGMAYIRALEVATFYTMFQLQPVGRKAHVQVCGTTPCRLRGAGELIGICQKRIAAHAHELSADGDFSWEEMECLGACVNAPMVQVWSDTYEDLTPETFNNLLDEFAAGRQPKPGPQNGRRSSEPEGGAKTLTDPSLYDGSCVRGDSAYRPKSEPTGEKDAPPTEAARPKDAELDHKDVKVEDKPQPPAKEAGEVPAAVARAKPQPEPEKPAAPAPEAKSVEAQQPPAAAPAAVAGPAEQPKALDKARGDKPDNLRQISGVGPKIESTLHKLGVFHFDQIAAWTPENIAWIDEHLKFRGRIQREGWIEQAQTLAAGGETEFSARQKKR